VRVLALIGAALALIAAIPPASAQTKSEIVPDVWQGDVLRPKPEIHVDRIRFITDSDYPPFQYFDEEGVLTGFNVDLARAICEALGVECDIRPVEWEDLYTDLDNGEADAAIASIRIDAGQTSRSSAPSFACTRSQGSKGRPSSRVHQAYRSIGMRG